MVAGDAGTPAETPAAHPEGRGRNPREDGMGASKATATEETSYPEPSLLMEAVLEGENMRTAFLKVRANKGAAGVDGMTVEQMGPYLKEHWPSIKAALLDGMYQPAPIRPVSIPKPGGGERMLGIPTVLDRLVQQALHQIRSPIFEVGFSEHSYGFRPGRSAHGAVLQAQRYVGEGRRYVVDLDLEKFFDRVNHDILMARLARSIGDKRVLALIRPYLQAGMMEGGIAMARTEGTPQGGPLSPLLSNVLLTDLDRELERRGHAFCRYADDCNVYVRSAAAGKRVMASLVRFLDRHLKLKVNEAKSAVARPWERKFLGYSMTFHKRPRLKVASASVKRLKGNLREVFRRGRGCSLRRTVETLKPKLRGWVAYFRLAEVKNVFEDLDGWIRRKLRCILWRQKKRRYARFRMLVQRGLAEERAWQSVFNGRGPWWNAGASHMNAAFPKSWFDHLGLVSLLESKQRLQRAS
ncbi:MAG: group II intron reverse transcriptase/maturase [Candidatus Sericytochromatia bacterium]|nr:group II intron reverse transcriptase/maturase [Candidatus Sericytochromatia bacterium]